MNRKIKHLIGLCLILVILIGAFYWLSSSKESDNEAATMTAMPLVEFAFGDIESITIKSHEEVLTIERAKQSWSDADKSKAYKLNQSTISKVVRSIIELEAMERVETNAPKDLSPYGLDDPTSIAVNLVNDSVKKIYIGGKTIRETYYLMVSDDPSIYEVDLGTGRLLGTSPKDYRDKTLMLAIEEGSVDHLLIKRQNHTSIEIEAITEATMTQSISSHKLLQPFEVSRDVNSDKVEGIYLALNGLTMAKDIVENMPSDLSVYGLKDPVIDIMLKDDKQEVNLLVGDQVKGDEQLVYAMLSGGASVYTIDGGSIDYIKDLEAFDLIYHFIRLVNVDTVDQVVVKRDEDTYVIDIEPSEAKVSDAKQSYKLDGKSITPEDFRDVYQLMIGLSIDSVTQETTDVSNAVISIDYKNLSDNQLSHHVAFVKYNEFFYSAYINQAYVGVIAKKDVYEIFSRMEELTLK